MLNLAINARDAMTEVGRLTISVSDRKLKAADLSDQDQAEPGDYIEIKVSDTGVGMTPDVLSRAFEPFFTTHGPRRAVLHDARAEAATSLELAKATSPASCWSWSGRTTSFSCAPIDKVASAERP